jgi:hypothetical protein
MLRRTAVELGLVGAAAVVAWAVRGMLPRTLPVGELTLYASALLLFQGLVRDLYLKYVAPAPAQCAIGELNKGKCLCMESTIGIVGIAAGSATLVTMGMHRQVRLPGWIWPLLVLAIGSVGFLVQEFVIDWKALRLRRGLDHRKLTL